MADWEGYMEGRNTAEAWDEELARAEAMVDAEERASLAQHEEEIIEDTQGEELYEQELKAAPGKLADIFGKYNISPVRSTQIIKILEEIQELYWKKNVPLDAIKEAVNLLTDYRDMDMPDHEDIWNSFKVFEQAREVEQRLATKKVEKARKRLRGCMANRSATK